MQTRSGEFPGKRFGDSFVMLLKLEKPGFQFIKTLEIIWETAPFAG